MHMHNVNMYKYFDIKIHRPKMLPQGMFEIDKNKSSGESKDAFNILFSTKTNTASDIISPYNTCH